MVKDLVGVFVDFTLTTTHFFFEELTRTRMVRDFLPLMVPQLLLILTYLLPLTEYLPLVLVRLLSLMVMDLFLARTHGLAQDGVTANLPNALALIQLE